MGCRVGEICCYINTKTKRYVSAKIIDIDNDFVYIKNISNGRKYKMTIEYAKKHLKIYENDKKEEYKFPIYRANHDDFALMDPHRRDLYGTPQMDASKFRFRKKK